MGIHSIINMCSHIQNSTRARLGITSVPSTKYNLQLALAMHKAGLFSSVYRGGLTPPDPETMETTPPEIVTHANVATRRLWLGLKYVNNKPVIYNVRPISKSSRWVTADLASLRRIVNGVGTKMHPGLTLGESLFVGTDLGVLDAREAVDRRRGGLLLCRVS